MTVAAILRLYEEFIEAADRAARSMDTDRRHVARLEAEICHHLEQSGGMIVVGQMEFRHFVVTIGKEERLSYFRVMITRERRVEANGYSFDRRRTDVPDPVIPVSAQRLRRKEARS